MTPRSGANGGPPGRGRPPQAATPRASLELGSCVRAKRPVDVTWRARPRGLLATRLSGEPVYTGNGSAAESGLDFTLRAVRAPGSAAVAVRARLSDDGLDIFGISGRVPEEPAQTPQRMSRPGNG
jgi:hypothetical protein